MRYLTLVLAVLCSTAHADRGERIQVLMESQGLLPMFQQQVEYQKEEIVRQTKIIEDQFMSKMNPSPEYMAKFSEANWEFTNSLVNVFTAKEIVSLWAEFYGPSFSDQELEGLIRYYTSPLGKKDVSVSQSALAKYNEATSKKMAPVVEKAIETYVERLRVISQECKCTR